MSGVLARNPSVLSSRLEAIRRSPCAEDTTEQTSESAAKRTFRNSLTIRARFSGLPRSEARPSDTETRGVVGIHRPHLHASRRSGAGQHDGKWLYRSRLRQYGTKVHRHRIKRQILCDRQTSHHHGAHLRLQGVRNRSRISHRGHRNHHSVL